MFHVLEVFEELISWRLNCLCFKMYGQLLHYYSAHSPDEAFQWPITSTIMLYCVIKLGCLSLQQLCSNTSNLYILTHPVNFTCEKTHFFWQSVDLFFSHSLEQELNSKYEKFKQDSKIYGDISIIFQSQCQT